MVMILTSCVASQTWIIVSVRSGTIVRLPWRGLNQSSRSSSFEAHQRAGNRAGLLSYFKGKHWHGVSLVHWTSKSMIKFFYRTMELFADSGAVYTWEGELKPKSMGDESHWKWGTFLKVRKLEMSCGLNLRCKLKKKGAIAHWVGGLIF